jgi:DNA-binding NarL/FixJ family response regulator
MREAKPGLCSADGQGHIRALLIAGSGEVRAAIERAIATDAGTCVAAVVADDTAALESIGAVAVDLVLVEASTLGLDAGAGVRRLTHGSGRQVPVVVVGAAADEYVAARLLAAGAFGYVIDGALDAELVQAIRTAYAGKRYISPPLRDRMAFKYIDGSR